MQKRNTEPLAKQPEIIPDKVLPDGDNSYRPADGTPVAQPQDLRAELKRGYDQADQGLAQKSLHDVAEGGRIFTAALNVASGGDTMRPAVEHVANSDAVPGAVQEYHRYRSTLQTENPGVFRRLDQAGLDQDVAGYNHATQMCNLYQSRLTEMDRLKRHYEGRIAPTLIGVFYNCRDTIENHTDLVGNMGEMTRLAVGTGQDAAANRGKNSRLRQEGADAVAATHEPPPSHPAPGTTTTVTTPGPILNPPAPQPAAHPPKAHPPKAPPAKG